MCSCLIGLNFFVNLLFRGRDMDIDQKGLQKLVEQISLDYFGVPFEHRASFNNRLRTTGGRYLLRTHDIELNKKYLDECGLEELIGIIKHELCHYHLHIRGKGYQHRDKDFKLLLKKVDAPRFCKPLKSNKEVFKHVYRCINCAHIYKRKRQMDIKKYVCGSCNGKLKKIK